MSCYTYIILKLYFRLKYNGLAIVRKTTKLIESGQHGFQYYIITSSFLTFFSKYKIENSKSRDFLRVLLCFICFVELWWEDEKLTYCHAIKLCL